MPDLSSGFKSFITYFGFNFDSELDKLNEFIANSSGYCRDGENKRSAKRTFSRYEAKIRDLNSNEVINLINLI